MLMAPPARISGNDTSMIEVRLAATNLHKPNCPHNAEPRVNNV